MKMMCIFLLSTCTTSSTDTVAEAVSRIAKINPMRMPIVFSCNGHYGVVVFTVNHSLTKDEHGRC
ncbi:hypothetical protein WN943_005421 [Citrus x changshan-huyou]